MKYSIVSTIGLLLYSSTILDLTNDLEFLLPISTKDRGEKDEDIP